MTWRDKLQPASFRGVAFQVEAGDNVIGRRVAGHQYPLRDTPYPEDMGKRQREFGFDAFVIGDDYFAQRDKLIKALEQKGTGTLIHPYWGSLQVQVTECRIGERFDEGRMARFSLQFIEAGRNENPAETADTRARTLTQAEKLTESLAGDFAQLFGFVGVNSFVQFSAVTMVNQLLTKILAMPSFTGYQYAISIARNVTSLILQPQDLSRQIYGMAGLLSYVDQRTLFGYGDDLPDVPLTTPSRRQQALNQAALSSAVQINTLAAAAQQADTIGLDSKQAAIAYRDQITAQIDAVEPAVLDETYFALADLRAIFVRDINNRIARLPLVIQFENDRTRHSLILSHDLYGTAMRADELVARNHISHPGFVPGGQSIEYLH